MKKLTLFRRVSLGILALALMLLAAIPAFASTLPDAPNSYVLDEADVISAETERYINMQNEALAEDCGAEIVFVTVDFTGDYSTADYAYELFNKWGIGDKKKNNGLLFLLAVGAEDYYAMPGSGITDLFSGGTLSSILNDYMEADFAAGDYDAGVRKTFDRALSIMKSYYDLGDFSAGSIDIENEINRVHKTFVFRFIMRAVIMLLVLFVIFSFTLKIFRRPGGSTGPGFIKGFLLGSMNHNRSSSYRSSNSRGYSRSSRSSSRSSRGFSSGRTSGGGARRSSSSRRSGGFGGGSSRGGGAGRR